MGAAEQQQFSQYPLRYGDGTLGAAIAQTRGGKDELVTPVALWELDDSSGLYLPPGLSQNPRRPRVDAQLSGSNLQPEVITLTTTPLAAGASGQSAIFDLTAPPGYGLAEILVDSDKVVLLDVSFDDGSHGLGTDRVHMKLAVHPDAAPQQGIPAFRPFGRRMQVFWSNPTPMPQTKLNIYLLRYPYTEMAPRNVRALLAYDLAIRDTGTHNPSTDPGGVWYFHRVMLGGGKVPVFVQNDHDQAVSATVQLVIVGTLSMSLGTVEVPAGSKKLITNQDFPGIDVPSEGIFLSFAAAVAPTTGTLRAWVDSLVGGSA